MIIPAIVPHAPVALPTPVALEPVRRSDTDNKSKQKDSQAEGETSQGRSLSNQTLKGGVEDKLSEEEKAEVQRLAQRDREVRAHEAAHKGAAGRYARGGAEFSYTRGPDGRQYASGGEVSIDVSTPNDPQEALRKAQIIQRAALAPAQPSGQDRAVAAQAAEMATNARAELNKQKSDSLEEENEPKAVTTRADVTQAYTTTAPEAITAGIDLTA